MVAFPAGYFFDKDDKVTFSIFTWVGKHSVSASIKGVETLQQDFYTLYPRGGMEIQSPEYLQEILEKVSGMYLIYSEQSVTDDVLTSTVAEPWETAPVDQITKLVYVDLHTFLYIFADAPVPAENIRNYYSSHIPKYDTDFNRDKYLKERYPGEVILFDTMHPEQQVAKVTAH